MLILKRLVSQLLETIYFAIFWFILAIPGSIISTSLRNSINSESSTQAQLTYLIISTIISITVLLVAPLLYSLVISKIGSFLSYKQLGFKLINYKTKEPVSKRHFTLRMYVRVILYPFVAFTVLPYFLPVIISKGKRTIYYYILGTEVEVLEK
jgi:hypothetical protein